VLMRVGQSHAVADLNGVESDLGPNWDLVV
jgi:hypothetical protein